MTDIKSQVEARKKEEAELLAQNKPAAAPDQAESPDFKFLDECFFANEMGDGIYFAYLFKEKYVYVKKGGYWMRWSGHHWEVDHMETVYHGVEEVALAYLNYANLISAQMNEAAAAGETDKKNKLKEKKSALMKRASQLRATNRPDACLRWAHRVSSPLAIAGDEIDNQPWLLACENGVIDLKTGVLRPGRPDDYLVNAIDHEWEGIDAPATTFEAYLKDIFEAPHDLAEQAEEHPSLKQYLSCPEKYTEDLIAGLRRIVGYAITGLSLHHFFLVLNGSGRNGKSTLVEIIKHILKPLAGIIMSEILLEQGRSRSSSGPSPDVMLLKGLRIAFASETDENRRFSPGMVKWLSGGDTLKARDLHKGFVEFEPTHTLVLLTNNLPHAPAEDYPFWERLKLIPFNWTYRTKPKPGTNEKKIDPDLLEKLKKETPGILAWMVRGCLEYQVQGLNYPQIIQTATEQYRNSEDTVGIFITDCCCRDDDSDKVTFKEVYAAFKGWYIEYRGSEKTVMAPKKFSELMKKHFRRVNSGGTIYFHGFYIKQEFKV